MTLGPPASAAPPVHVTEIDGVRCLWVDMGLPTLTAELAFRVGRVDEPYVEAGWLHLLEHCALHERGGGALQINGSVNLLSTGFQAHGPADAVAGHLTDVAAWLGSPILDDVEHEARILAAEQERRGDPGPLGRALGWRFGPRGPGIVTQSEPGLARVDEAALRERAARVFSRQNAVLMLDGPPPPGLRLALGDGVRLEIPAALPVEDDFPAAYVDEAGAVLSGLAPRSGPLWVAHDLLRIVLERDLRHQAAGAYAPWSAYEPIDATTAVVVAGSDLAQSVREEGAERALAAVDGLLADGVSEALLADLRAASLQRLQDPRAAASTAWARGMAWLEGREERTVEDLARSVVELEAADVDAALAAWRTSLLIGLPGVTPAEDRRVLDGRVPMLQFPRSEPSPEAQRFRHRNAPRVTERLAVDGRGVELVDRTTARRIAFDDVIGLHRLTDGARHLVGVQGYTITVDPRRWHRGPQAVALIDAGVPEHLHLVEDHGLEPPFERTPWLTRWTGGYDVLTRRLLPGAGRLSRLGRALLWGAAGVVALAVGLAALGLLSLLPDPVVGTVCLVGPPLALGSFLGGWIKERRRQRAQAAGRSRAG